MRRLDFPFVLCGSHPGLVSFGTMMLGFIILALSFFWHVGQVSVELLTQDGKPLLKEVGYGSAPNWSLTLTLLLPATLLYICKIYNLFPMILRDLAASHMVVSEDLAEVSPKDLVDLWSERLRRYRKWLILLIAAAFFFSLWEWFTNSAWPLWKNNAALAPESDWSVGTLFDSAGRPTHAMSVRRVENAALSFLAFLGQGLIVAAVLTFVYKALIAGVFVSELSRPQGKFRLIPDLKSRDSRLGFEVFGELIEMSLVCVGLFYGIFYMSRMQNIYMRSRETGIATFIVDRLLIGITDKPFDFGVATEAFRSGMKPESNTFDYSSIMVSFGAFSVLMIAAFMISSTVRDAAIRSRNELRFGLRRDPTRVQHLFGIDPSEAERRLDSMVFWPVRYIRAREFFGLIVLGVTCIFFYRLGLILVGLLLFRVFWDVARYIFGSSQDSKKIQEEQATRTGDPDRQ